MIHIYTPVITNRIRYVFEFVFKEQLKLKYRLTQDLDHFKESNLPKVSYAEEKVDKELIFRSSGFLHEKGVKPQKLSVDDYKDTKIFFNVFEDSALPFDVFSAIFYMISRYEEYLPMMADKYGRFPAEESFAYKNGFLHQAVVNRYILMIKEVLLKWHPDLHIPDCHYKFTPTYDIDSAYAFINKGVIRNVGGFINSFSKLDFTRAKSRMKALLHLERDPYDTFDWQTQLHEDNNLNPIYFFLVGDYDENDKNISINITSFQSLIKSIADYAEVGVHPSFSSNYNPDKLKMEISRLSLILKREITKSRQHFLKLRFPKTYQNLIDFDITDDYTMGYPSQLGFRAGTCSSFYFYNVERETKTNLRIHPFCIMDATMQYYLFLHPDGAIKAIENIIKEVKHVGGHLITLWHNSSLSDQQEWAGWKKVYVKLLEMARE